MRSLYKECKNIKNRNTTSPKELQTTVDRSITVHYFTLSQMKYPVIKLVASASYVNDSNQDPVTADEGDVSLRRL